MKPVLAGLVVAAAMAVPAQAEVSTGQSGWNWSSPQPQGNQINDIGFSGGTGYAVGNFGTVIATPDGGQTWTGINTGIAADINKVSLPTPGTLVVGGGCYDLISGDGGATFTQTGLTVPGPKCSPTLTSQSFPSATLGYVLADTGAVLQTADGGVSFSQRTAVPGTSAGNGGATATDITFTTATTGFALAGGTIFRTTDGANTWSPVRTVGQTLNSLFFADNNHGYAVGAGSTVLKTTDGGSTWTSQPGATGPGGALNLTKIRCGSNDLCLIVNDQGTGLVRTDDGGSTYSFVVPANAPINAAAFANTSRAVAAGANGATFISSDGGKTFTPVGSALSQQLDGIRALSSGFVYGWGQNGAVATSANGGGTWTPNSIPSSNAVATASFADASNGYALDTTGTLWGTTNGGTSWARKDTGGGADPNDVADLSSSTVLLIGPKGVRRSTNAGRDFAAVAGKPVATARLSAGEAVGSLVFAYGQRAILSSSNNGAKWSAIALPKSGKRTLALEQTHCTSSRVCWALARNSHLYRTGNAGRTWTDLTVATGNNDLNNGGNAQLSFDGGSSGFVAIPSFEPVSENLGSSQGASGQGWVLATNDAGSTWAPQLMDSNGVNGIAATGATDFALTDSNHLFSTMSNGAAGQSSSLTISTGGVRTIKRPTTVTLTISLSPFNGGEPVLVSGPGANKVVNISSSGTASLQVRVSRTSAYVAQWAGDADTNGDGSKVVTITRK